MSEVKQGRATQEAVTALTQYLIESGAENYIEDHYTISLDGGEPTTAVITVQYTDKPSAHEFRVRAEAERDQLAADNKRLEAESAQLKAALANHTARRYVGDDDQRKIDDLVAAGIRVDQQEIKRLRRALDSLMRLDVAGHQLQDRLQFSTKGRDVLHLCQAALSTTANGEVSDGN